MTKALSVVRSILFFLYMALTVIPWGLTVCICAPFLSAGLSNLLLMGALLGVLLNTQRTWGRAVLTEKDRAIREAMA